MNKFITILILSLTLSTAFASNESIKDRIQQNVKEDSKSNTADVAICKKKIERYIQKLEKYSDYANAPNTSYNKWKHDHYQSRLAWWIRYCR